jgi:hypothetical protein
VRHGKLLIYSDKRSKAANLGSRKARAASANFLLLLLRELDCDSYIQLLGASLLFLCIGEPWRKSPMLSLSVL